MSFLADGEVGAQAWYPEQDVRRQILELGPPLLNEIRRYVRLAKSTGVNIDYELEKLVIKYVALAAGVADGGELATITTSGNPAAKWIGEEK